MILHRHLSIQLLKIVALLSLFGCQQSLAQDLPEHIATIVDAQSIERVPPKYPVESARKGQEGWAKVSFVIDKEGNVLDLIIQDSSGLPSFEKAALRAISQWKYSPAMQDGKPIEQCQSQVQMDFVLDGKGGVTRSFKQDYTSILDAISANKLDEAEAKLAELGQAQLWNLTESTYYWVANAVYAKEIKDTKTELRSIRRALSGKIGKKATKGRLQDDNIAYLLERKFVLSLTESQYANAMEAFAQLKTVEGSEQSVIRLQPYADQLSQLLKGEDPLVLTTVIEPEHRFFHKLSRDSFSLVIDHGDLDEVEIRCANKRSRFTVAENSEWHIPSTWGQCTIFVSGSPETAFSVVETGHYVGEI